MPLTPLVPSPPFGNAGISGVDKCVRMGQARGLHFMCDRIVRGTRQIATS